MNKFLTKHAAGGTSTVYITIVGSVVTITISPRCLVSDVWCPDGENGGNFDALSGDGSGSVG